MIKNILPALAFIWGIALTLLVSFVDLPTLTTTLICIFAVLNIAASLFAVFGEKSKRFGKYFNQEQVVKQTDFSTKSYWSIVWFQFKKNKLSVFGLIMIFVLVLTAIIAPFIAHNKPFLRQDYDFSEISQDTALVYFYQNTEFKTHMTILKSKISAKIHKNSNYGSIGLSRIWV